MDKEENQIDQAVGWGYRHQQTAILFCCLTVAYSMRGCMGVSLVDMTENSDTSLFNTNHTGHNVTLENGGVIDAFLFAPPFPKFEWNKKTQDVILSSFNWGYIVLQIPAGMLTHRFGWRHLLAGAMMINCVVSICLPWAAYYGGWVLVVIFRMIQGLSQACIIPGMHTAFGKWIPLEELGRLAAFAYGGQALGLVVGMFITGYIAASSFGWPGIFRFYGILSGLIGGILWWLGADCPAQHKTITIKEQLYIEKALRQIGGHETLPVPWKKILTSSGMIAIIFAHISHAWGHFTLYAELPAFMSKIMKLDIETNGLLTSFPFLMMWLASFFFSYATDMLIAKNILSVTHTRKLLNSIDVTEPASYIFVLIVTFHQKSTIPATARTAVAGIITIEGTPYGHPFKRSYLASKCVLSGLCGCIPTALGLIALVYVKKDIYIVETIFVIICVSKTALLYGFHINHIDISPNFAGTMMGISNFVANCASSLAPILAGFILTDVSSEALWGKVFFVSAGLFLITNLVYVIFGTAELADWNEPKNKEEANIILGNR